MTSLNNSLEGEIGCPIISCPFISVVNNETIGASLLSKNLKAKSKRFKGLYPSPSVIILPVGTEFTISDRENRELLEAIFKDQAGPYFALNGPIRVYLDFDHVSSHNGNNHNQGTLLTQMGIGVLDSCSPISGSRHLGLGYKLRGVLEAGEDSTSQNKLGGNK